MGTIVVGGGPCVVGTSQALVILMLGIRAATEETHNANMRRAKFEKTGFFK